MQISDFLSSQCRCSQTQKTAAHIILHCSLYIKIRERLCALRERLNIKILVSSSKNAQTLAQWFIKLHTFLKKFIKILIFNLFSETHSFLLIFAYNEQWKMICTAVFCICSHLHWKEKKFRIYILLKKAVRSIQSVCICIRITLSVFLRSLCVFKILWHDVLTLTRFHWYDLWSHFFFHQCCTACCELILLMSSDDMNHWSAHLICFSSAVKTVCDCLMLSCWCIFLQSFVTTFSIPEFRWRLQKPATLESK